MKIFFDILITILIFITASPAVILLYELRKENTWEKRHKKLTIAFSAVLLLGTVTIIYGSFIEPQFLVINKQEIDLPGITKPIKIAFIADFQVGPYKREDYAEKVVKEIIALEPDLVILGGDHVDNGGTTEDETKYLAPLAELPKHAPTFAIHGNHEYGVGTDLMVAFENKRLPDVSREVEQAMTAIKIDYLTNELRLLSINGQKFYLFGGNSSEARKLNFSELKNRDVSVPTIGLLHDPRDVITASSHDIDVMLAGHTHGGQIRLPFFGPLGRIDSYTPLSWYKGWSEYNKTKFFVTSGVGETGARSRLFNPPEIVLLTIK
ncbi:MAG: metallophosphoesterase [Patescibacteria group bacterium]